VIPSYTNPQDQNRYSYVNNNPLRYNDPTGHVRVGDDNRGKNKASLNCSKNSQYCKNGKPMTKDELKAVWDNRHPKHEATTTVAKSSSTNSSSGGASATTNAKTLISDYDPGAIVWGFGFSGSTPSNYNIAGMEELALFENGKRAVFTYGGEGSSVGLGASGAAYGGIVFNIKDPDAYVGPLGSAGVTLSVLDVGVTVSYFWDSSEAPLSPSITQGVAVGYAPGAQASVWWSSTTYSEIWRSDE
jgi:hypothetical protein